MDLVWGEVDANYSQRAFDQQGRPAATISGEAWPRTAWIHPRWCGIEGGCLIHDIDSWEYGRAAVEQCIAEYLARTGTTRPL